MSPAFVRVFILASLSSDYGITKRCRCTRHPSQHLCSGQCFCEKASNLFEFLPSKQNLCTMNAESVLLLIYFCISIPDTYLYPSNPENKRKACVTPVLFLRGRWKQKLSRLDESHASLKVRPGSSPECRARFGELERWDRRVWALWCSGYELELSMKENGCTCKGWGRTKIEYWEYIFPGKSISPNSVRTAYLTMSWIMRSHVPALINAH